MFQAINTFAELFEERRTKIEDAMRDGIIKREELSRDKGRRTTYNSGSHQANHSKATDVNALSQSNGQRNGVY